MKKSFPIPEGCTSVTVEQIDNRLIATFEEKFIPKDGEFCASVGGGICIYKEEGSRQPIVYCGAYNGKVYYDTEDFTAEMRRLATESEKQTLLDALAKDGKAWDAENKKVVKLRWTPKECTPYFYAYTYYGKAFVCDGVSCDDMVTRERVKSGNCYQMQSEAQSVADRINAIFAENL